MSILQLNDRAIIRIDPLDDKENPREFLQGLVTNDVMGNLPSYAALLSAQGKTMFDFFIWEAEGNTLLLDCEKQQAESLIKRLSLYRLRRRLTIELETQLAVVWSKDRFDNGIADPRLPALGYRAIAPVQEHPIDTQSSYLRHRLALGVPEGQAELEDVLWLEINAIELNGVSFEKGCYIGQENTARMNWRQKINRRLVVVPLEKSDEKRRKIAYPDLSLAIDHLRIADMDGLSLPDWQRVAIAD